MVNDSLLDVNVVLSLLDPEHPFHPAAVRWFYSDPERSWLTSPTVENGVIRISTGSGYTNRQTPEAAVSALRTLTRAGHHKRVPDDVSLLHPEIDPRHLQSSRQVTDLHLALLAHAHDAQLATFDRRIISTAALKVPVKIFQIPA